MAWLEWWRAESSHRRQSRFGRVASCPQHRRLDKHEASRGPIDHRYQRVCAAKRAARRFERHTTTCTLTTMFTSRRSDPHSQGRKVTTKSGFSKREGQLSVCPNATNTSASLPELPVHIKTLGPPHIGALSWRTSRSRWQFSASLDACVRLVSSSDNCRSRLSLGQL